MFSFITQNWQGCPLVSHEAVINLIGHTATATGPRIKAKLNRKKYPTGMKISDLERAQVRLQPAKFHREWNYTIVPDT